MNFYRNYEEYTNGFGDVRGEHWLGLENMHQLTKTNPMHVRLELVGCGSDQAAAEYGTFAVRFIWQMR